MSVEMLAYTPKQEGFESTETMVKPEKKEKHRGTVTFFEMFRFSDMTEKLLILAGCISAGTHGAFYVMMNIIIGQQVDVFIDNDKSNNYLMHYKNCWEKYNYTREELRENKTLIDEIVRIEGNNCNSTKGLGMLNSSYLTEFDRNAVFDLMVQWNYIYMIIAAVVLFAACGQIAFFILAAERQVRKIRTSFLKAVLRQDVAWYDKHGIGEMNTRLADDMYKIVDGMGDKLGTLIQLMVMCVSSFIIGFVYGWEMSVIMLGVVPALMLAALVSSKLSATLTNQELKAYAKAGKVAEEVLGSIRTVSAFGGEETESERYNHNLFDAKAKGIRKGLILGLGMGLVYFILYCSYAFGFWFGVNLVLDNENYSAGRLLIVFFSIVLGAIAIGQSGPNVQAVATARGACYEVFRIIDHEPEIDSFSTKGITPNHLEGNVTFNNVFFRYPTRPDVKVLNGLNLEVKVGQTVALVGSSGCGKSTSIQLMQRFYDPLSGSISIDGHNIKDLNIKWLRQNIGIVSQEPVLFGTTIAENISYGREGCTNEEIEDAAKMANAHNFISKLPLKYETLVGDRGAQLSGGQKQRIAIARALVRNPKILLLDEATSALDTESEAIVQNALDKASKGRTTIVIAHRLSTVRQADLICGFEGGIIVEKGSHQELLDYGGIYYQLVTLQTKEQAINEQAAKMENEEKKVPLDVDDVILSSSPPDEEVRDRGFSLKSLTGSFRGSMKRRPGAGIGYAAPAIGRMVSTKDDEDYENAYDELLSDPKIKPAPISRILKMNSDEWGYMVMGCVGALITGAEPPFFGVLFTLMLEVFTRVVREEQLEMTKTYIIAFVIIGVIIFFGYFLQNYMFANSGERLTMRLRRTAFRSMLKQEMGWFDMPQNNLGALTTRLATDSSSVQGATGSRLGLILQNIANISVGLVMGFIFGWKLALLMCAFLPILVVTGAFETRVLAGVASSDKKELEKAGKVALEAIENIRTVASLTKEMMFHDMYNDKLEKPYRNAIRKAYVFGFSFSISQALIYVIFGVSFVFGGWLVSRNEMTFDGVFLVITVVLFSATSIGQTFAFAPDYTKARVAASRLFYLFDREPPIDVSNQGGDKINTFDGTCSFEDVHFRYPARAQVPVLRGITLSVEPGKTLALVGSSGCGKSTTVSLIERFYDGIQGQVLFGGQDIKGLNLKWVRQQIGIVSQEPVLFDKTIAENIAYGDTSRKVSTEEIIAAAKKSNIHNFIASLPLGYETSVGDRGTQLSGGQKQRVAIARALVRQPKILLLDEATSALDTESEKIVQDALDKAREGRTCIVIAHRLSTIQDADQIAVFHQGKVVELGTHQELLALEGIYWNLQQVQARKK